MKVAVKEEKGYERTKKEKLKDYERIENMLRAYQEETGLPPSKLVERLLKFGAVKLKGETISFDKYLDFQLHETDPSEIEVVVGLERMIARGLVAKGMSKALIYAIALVIVIIGLGIGLYIIREVFR